MSKKRRDRKRVNASGPKRPPPRKSTKARVPRQAKARKDFQKRSSASHKGWETRRQKSKARSEAARNGWVTRRLKGASGQADETIFLGSELRTAGTRYTAKRYFERPLGTTGTQAAIEMRQCWHDMGTHLEKVPQVYPTLWASGLIWLATEETSDPERKGQFFLNFGQGYKEDAELAEESSVSFTLAAIEDAKKEAEMSERRLWSGKKYDILGTAIIIGVFVSTYVNAPHGRYGEKRNAK